MKHLMLMSTHTGVGKHTITCGLLRSFARRGADVTPFKGVSIEHHTCTLPDGREISFAQTLQAMAAGKVPTPAMNPYVALYGERFCLIELGRRLEREQRPHMVRDRQHYLDVIERAFDEVTRSSAAIVEGAGSPVELGLENVDLANVPVARIAGAGIVLVTEMTHGGGYASVVGTLSLLPDDVRERVVAVVLNKFEVREPAEFVRAGMARLRELVGVPVMSLPYLEDTFVPGDAALNAIEYARLGDYTAAFDALADVVEEHLDVGYLAAELGIG